jgi:hypothetical protein
LPQWHQTKISYNRNGARQVLTRFGADKGESFDLVIYKTDSLASQYFISTIQN